LDITRRCLQMIHVSLAPLNLWSHLHSCTSSPYLGLGIGKALGDLRHDVGQALGDLARGAAGQGLERV